MGASKVFISYRREDSAGHAGRVFDHLVRKLGRDHVFRDVDNIRPVPTPVHQPPVCVVDAGLLPKSFPCDKMSPSVSSTLWPSAHQRTMSRVACLQHLHCNFLLLPECSPGEQQKRNCKFQSRFHGLPLITFIWSRPQMTPAGAHRLSFRRYPQSTPARTNRKESCHKPFG